MNLLVIRPPADSGRSSNSVANRMSDRNFDVIDFIRDASRADEMRFPASRLMIIDYQRLASIASAFLIKNLTKTV
jgi:hypothetical protein